MKTPKAIVMILFLWMLAGQTIGAQEPMETGKEATAAPDAKEWYGGIVGGVPFGTSTFSSFGADKTRAGYTLGLFGGYRFNPVLSAELAMKWGKTSLSARDCCAEGGYWLGADGMSYHAPVAGFDGYDYADLKSSVSLQQYGVSLNVNLLGLFRQTRQSRWRLELSPMLAAVGTKADVKTIAEGNSLIKDKTRWHLGAGGKLQAAYSVTDKLHLGLYSGITYLTGKGMDGVAEHIHDANYLWESGVRIGWTFGKCRRKQIQGKKEILPAIPETGREDIETPVQSESGVVSIADQQRKEEQQDRKEEKGAIEKDALDFPVIYFDFNNPAIRADETAKLQAIRDTLRNYPDVHIRITGWCDQVGSRTVNKRISLRRAESVKSWLVGQGIDASRIEVRGMGIDYDEPDASKARRAVTEEDRKETKQ